MCLHTSALDGLSLRGFTLILFQTPPSLLGTPPPPSYASLVSCPDFPVFPFQKSACFLFLGIAFHDVSSDDWTMPFFHFLLLASVPNPPPPPPTFFFSTTPQEVSNGDLLAGGLTWLARTVP